MPLLTNTRNTGCILLVTLCLLLCSVFTHAEINQYQYRVLETLPHSQHTFTQGLIVDGDQLIESSGLYRQSFVQRYSKSSTAMNHPLAKRTFIAKRFFAEGIAAINDKLFLLTWKSGVAHQLNRQTLAIEKQHHYHGEGWGLSAMKDQLIMSDGSDRLQVRAPENFKLLHTITVTHPHRNITYLNDLTYANGLIWANVWQQDHLLAINPQSGQVVAELDLSALTQKHSSNDPDDTLNGIAWDTGKQALWVTGKRWSKLYLLQITPTQKKN